jgi:DNA-directed RNA polymerase subunit alpha
MADASATLDLKGLLTSEDVPLQKLHEVRREVHCRVDLRNQLEELMADFGSKVAKQLSSDNKAEVRKGTAQWLLGKAEEAVQILQPARTSKERSYVLGVSLLESGRPTGALEPLKDASGSDASDPLITAALAEARLLAGKIEEAEGLIEKLQKKGDNAQGHYLEGLLADLQGRREAAVKAYEKAMELDPGHAPSMFRLACLYDLRGDDERALDLYEQLRKLRPMHVATVMNLGVLYEDRGEFEKAAICFQSILDYFPNHRRAQLYLRDAQASMTMFYDEEAARREAKLSQVLGQPVAEVSFSPRVRTALQRLGVNTLGDLVGKSEEDFLGIPNFGRTSLRELKEFLSSKGLSLASGGGMELGAPAPETATVAPDGVVSEEVLKRNLSEFEWSGRIRKVLEKMSLVTVGDLLGKTEKDLLKSKTLGVTSIKEIRKKLAQLGVAMKTE